MLKYCTVSSYKLFIYAVVDNKSGSREKTGLRNRSPFLGGISWSRSCFIGRSEPRAGAVEKQSWILKITICRTERISIQHHRVLSCQHNLVLKCAKAAFLQMTAECGSEFISRILRSDHWQGAGNSLKKGNKNNALIYLKL